MKSWASWSFNPIPVTATAAAAPLTFRESFFIVRRTRMCEAVTNQPGKTHCRTPQPIRTGLFYAAGVPVS